MKRHLLAAICIGLSAFAGQAQNFDDYFVNKTIRADYIFSGNSEAQAICLDELSSLPQWAGRRHHLSELPLAGNGEIEMKDKASGKIIYRTSFSSLFQEWICEAEAKKVTRGFENTFLIPFPKNTATVTIRLKDVYHKETASLTHEIDPKDILIHQRGDEASITPHRYLLKSGSEENCIDIAILAEGYTKEETELFYKDAQTACEALFSHEPFKKLKSRFNVVAVFSESKDSGVSIPRQNEWKKTAVSSHFDTFYSDRYLTTRSVKAIHNWLAGIPYEHIIILANTDTYGGGGIYNSYTLTTAHHPMFKPVVVHEFGHSFGGLADEYAYDAAPSPQYPYSIEPWEQNITTLADFDAKWKDMVEPGTPVPTPVQTEKSLIYTKVGVYEGAGYTQKGIYRPTTECRMKINEAPVFCPVCQRALEKLIRFYTDK
ncbi:M64 family metallopeptidase [Bacteroides gallinaceum]|uniref:M64 family metallopeptidase n=1 Tax=Bacteroides gallinaceum TaxID=1462571 RepID=A0ABT7VJJ1_9BACE|nr:M64 family metallopeptidase [Bacteroides gallinaceum]MDM8326432.1 M64 family metallopeptidase [Bacteroides gallinaceum]